MWLFILILISNSQSPADSNSVCKLPNTGSVLFRDIDMHRRYCWSREEIALVYTRRAMMELIPKQIPHNIPLILEFIQICLTTLQDEAPVKEVYDYMFAALADVFGGYLQTYGLPLLHEAYYEGYVSYDNAAEFHRLEDNLKAILMTNGEGWTKPMEVRKHINRILPLKLPVLSSTKPCSLLFTDNTCLSSAAEEPPSTNSESKPLIPLPILDDNKQPNSIAIPFKNHALFNLKSRSSYDILIKYYTETTRCISQSKKSEMEHAEFDRAFSNWLKDKVIPRLKDENWYVGFSNVFRIEETMQQRGGFVVAASERDTNTEEDSLFKESEEKDEYTTNAWIIVVIVIALLLLLCCCFWVCIRNYIMCCGKVDVESSKNETDDLSENQSLVSGPYEYSSSPSSAKGRNKKRVCKHNRNTSETSNGNPDSNEDINHPPSRRLLSEESRFTMSCGLGKQLNCHKHHH